MKYEKVFNVLMVSMILFAIVFSLIFGIPHTLSVISYKTNTIVTCVDGNKNIIEGVICYEKIDCSNLSWVKWMNDKRCEDYLG